ncbi:MAG TPA: sugar transferase [Puia sp.]|jgi:putative colanic acid biosynthesis UDP-glucose lipid carrier transferase|nr:sugar transferase [Puia sp.]
MKGKVHKSYLFFKRSFDIILAILLIIGVLSWLLPLMALLIKLDSRGPLFFLQKRIGKGGVAFTCYKLRTMVVNQQADECPASEDDKRITRFGKLLRKTHLDELPQLFNVLLGSMSIVGPRPYMLADSHKFSRMIPGHDYRNFVKPGITGLAQVKGLHGPKTDFKTIFWRYQWDAFYVRNADFLLDLGILRRTILFFFTQQMPI